MSMQSAAKVLETMPTPEQKAAAAASQPVPETKASENGLQPEKTAAKPDVSGVEEAPKTEPKKDDSSAKFAALAKREKAIVKQQQEIKAREASYAEREAAITAREAKIKESESIWDTDVFKALELRGYDYKKLTDLMLKGESAAPKAPIDAEAAVQKALADFEKRQAEKDASREAEQKKQQEAASQKQQEEYEQAYNNFRKEIGSFISTNSSEYELTALYDQTDLVVDTVQGYFDEHKKVLSIKEACEMVEKYLEEEAQKALKTKKLSKYAAPSETKTEEKKTSAPATKTLNNQMTPSLSSTLPAKTESDRMKRALSKLENTK